MSDTAQLIFRPRVQPVAYGDNRVFQEYKIAIFKGANLVGMEEGPRRIGKTRSEALKLARARIAELRKHRLFAIRVTNKHISDGEARNCNTCAISQALWHNQERMGFSKYEFEFRVSTYGCFVDAEGIVLRRKFYCGDEPARHLEPDHLPEIVDKWSLLRNRLYGEGMVEWTMSWDEWAESRYMSLDEWRDKHDYDDGERPCKPGPCSFVFDLDAMKDFKG